MEYLGAWGTLIHEKKLRSKISCPTPFKYIKVCAINALSSLPDAPDFLLKKFRELLIVNSRIFCARFWSVQNDSSRYRTDVHYKGPYPALDPE